MQKSRLWCRVKVSHHTYTYTTILTTIFQVFLTAGGSYQENLRSLLKQTGCPSRCPRFKAITAKQNCNKVTNILQIFSWHQLAKIWLTSYQPVFSRRVFGVFGRLISVMSCVRTSGTYSFMSAPANTIIHWTCNILLTENRLLRLKYRQIKTYTCFNSNLSNCPCCIVADWYWFWIQVHSQNLHELSYSQMHSKFA